MMSGTHHLVAVYIVLHFMIGVQKFTHGLSAVRRIKHTLNSEYPGEYTENFPPTWIRVSSARGRRDLSINFPTPPQIYTHEFNTGTGRLSERYRRENCPRLR